MRRIHIIGLVTILSMALATGTAKIAAAASGPKVKEKLEMHRTGSDDDARGKAKLTVRGGSDGRFDLKLQKLAPEATYEVVVDGVLVATVTTNGGGNARLRFRSRPRNDKDELLGFDPRGAIVIVRDASGDDVLGASVPTTGSLQPGDVICCVPDDSGPECEDRTPAECAAEGGVESLATSCLPNPCAGTPSPTDNDVVCCVPDDSGPDCEDRTADECSAEGGIVVEADSCADTPCAGVPSNDPDIQCCLADDSGPECEDRTPAECIALDGIDLGEGTCMPNPCGDVIPPGGGGTPSVNVTCERRASRSRISVDGSGLAAGSYQAVATSGANEAISDLAPAIGDQAEFDFDSDPGDIAAGATPIAADFIQGSPPMVLGQILDDAGSVVAEAMAACEDR